MALFPQEFHLLDDIFLDHYTLNDVPRVVWAMNNDQITKTLGGPPYQPYTEEHAHEFLNIVKNNMVVPQFPKCWAIRDRSQGKNLLIGSIDIRPSSKNYSLASRSYVAEDGHDEVDASFGFWLDPAYRRRGIMSKALETLVYKIGRDELGITKFWGDCMVGNTGSRKTMEKVGFKITKEIKDGVTKQVTLQKFDVWILELELEKVGH